jgi:hypothetical protein
MTNNSILRNIISSVLNQYLVEQQELNENIQLADKLYFNNGKLTNIEKEIILKITNGDNFTKIICDFYFLMVNEMYPYKNSEFIFNKLKGLYNDLKTYNKNVFPILGYDAYNTSNSTYEIIKSFEFRKKIIDNIQKLPSIAKRNLKKDIIKHRTGSQLASYLHSLDYFMSHIELLSNRDSETQIKIMRKMFKKDTSLDELLNFVEEKENLIGGVEITKDDVKELSKSEDFEIIYEQGEVMIVRVDSPNGIKAIGCNSLWCFTYGSGFDQAYRQWNNYSHNDKVYVIIDFTKKSDFSEFMYVLIKPLTDANDRFIKYNEDDDNFPLYNMSNENYQNPYYVLGDLFGEKYKKIIKKYLNFEY